ncbi:MAG TPA: hypothetical protein VF593_07420 [Chthoniobacteraceae bacterium]|jgi:hypothetical protein
MKKWFVPFALVFTWLLPMAGETSAQAPTAPASGVQFDQRVQVDVARSRTNRVGGGDFDDKTDRISFVVKLVNSDTKASFQGHKAEFYVWAQSIVNPKAFLLLTADQSAVSLLPRGTHEFTSKEGTTMYDTTGARFGAKYDGWVLVVRDSEGKVVLKKASQASWLPAADKLNTTKEKLYYNRELKPLTGVR